MYKLAHLVKFMNVNEPVVKNVAKINLIKNKPEEEKPDFLEVEEMGIQCPRRCQRCSNGSACIISNQHLTRKEQAELILCSSTCTWTMQG